MQECEAAQDKEATLVTGTDERVGSAASEGPATNTAQQSCPWLCCTGDDQNARGASDGAATTGCNLARRSQACCGVAVAAGARSVQGLGGLGFSTKFAASWRSTTFSEQQELKDARVW